jgi:hypothetical protein
MKAIAAMRMWFSRANRPGDVEYIFACNRDDPERGAIEDMVHAMGAGEMKIVVGDFHGSAAAWDAAAHASRGSMLIQAQDDVEPPEKWDTGLMYAINVSGHLFDWLKLPIFIAVSDGFRKDKLCCTAIMNRARYEQQGEFLHAGYLSVYSDDEVTLRAYADAAAGLCQLIEARDLVFLHRHHYHDKSVPLDDTYKKENSADAYAVGAALFTKRNEKAIAAGFRTWG